VIRNYKEFNIFLMSQEPDKFVRMLTGRRQNELQTESRESKLY